METSFLGYVDGDAVHEDGLDVERCQGTMTGIVPRCRDGVVSTAVFLLPRVEEDGLRSQSLTVFDYLGVDEDIQT